MGQRTPKAKQYRGRRAVLVLDVLDAMEDWLTDSVQQGLYSIRDKSPKIVEEWSKRCIREHAAGLGARLAVLAQVPTYPEQDWIQACVLQFGQIATLIQAYKHVESAPPLVQQDILRHIGFRPSTEEVQAFGHHYTDTWLVLGQASPEAFYDTARHFMWIVGAHNKLRVLVPGTMLAGTSFIGTIGYVPSAYLLQGRILQYKEGQPVRTFTRRLPSKSVSQHLKQVAQAITVNPWLERSLFIGTGRFGTLEQAYWFQDVSGQSLPVSEPDYTAALAITGGGEVDMTAEWDGSRLRILGILSNHVYELVRQKHETNDH